MSISGGSTSGTDPYVYEHASDTTTDTGIPHTRPLWEALRLSLQLPGPFAYVTVCGVRRGGPHLVRAGSWWCDTSSLVCGYGLARMQLRLGDRRPSTTVDARETLQCDR